jgi:hypothetical protein
MPWSPWVCVGYVAVMGAIGLLTAAVFGVRRGMKVDAVLLGS